MKKDNLKLNVVIMKYIMNLFMIYLKKKMNYKNL